MEIFKMILFFLVLAMVGIGGIASYRWLNRKILRSDKWGGVIGSILFLIVINLVILLGGTFVLIYLYRFLFVAE